MSFNAYKNYRDSGVRWFKDIPGHWKVSPYKHLIAIHNGRDHKQVETDVGYPVFGSGGEFSFSSEYLYDGQAVLLGRKGTVDKPLYVEGRFWTVDTMYWAKIRSGVHGKFAYYVATTIPFDYYSSNTALPSMTKRDLKSHRVALPSFAEQNIIATFLDKETARIDALIEKNERLISALDEKIRAEVDKVTQERPGAVRVRMSKACDYVSGKHKTAEETTPDAANIRYLRTADLYEAMSFDKAPLWLVEDEFEVMAYDDDVIVCFDGFVANEKTGTLGMAVTGATGHVGASLSIVAPRNNKKYSSELLKLAHLGNAFKECIVKHAEGVTAKHGQRGVKYFDIYIEPDVKTQNFQGKELRKLIQKTSLLKSNLKSLNTLLLEKRSALITAAVTGQIEIPAE